MIIIDQGVGRWIYYVEGEPAFDKNKVGKWMCYPHDLGVEDELSFSRKICSDAVSQGIVQEAKCRHINEKGVCCFYQNCDDMASHRRVIQFFLDNALIPKNKAGRLHKISFKLDRQTHSGQYGENYNPTITLNEFLDLDTGKWIV